MCKNLIGTASDQIAFDTFKAFMFYDPIQQHMKHNSHNELISMTILAEFIENG